MLPIEIKASESIASDFFNGLNAWNELAYGSETARDTAKNTFLIYAGEQVQLRTGGHVVPWKKSAHLIDDYLI